MKEWMIGVVITIFFTSIISLILPVGKLNATIKSIFSFLIILVIIQPLFNLRHNASFDFSNIFNENSVYVQTDYLEFINEKEIEAHKEKCIELLEEKGVYDAKIDIFYKTTNYYEILIEKVAINLQNSVIKADKEHIDILEQVKDVVCGYFSIEKNLVIIYE